MDAVQGEGVTSKWRKYVYSRFGHNFQIWQNSFSYRQASNFPSSAGHGLSCWVLDVSKTWLASVNEIRYLVNCYAQNIPAMIHCNPDWFSVASPKATKKRQEYKRQTILIIHCLFSEKSESEKSTEISGSFSFPKISCLISNLKNNTIQRCILTSKKGTTYGRQRSTARVKCFSR